jgi:hypothetical protein
VTPGATSNVVDEASAGAAPSTTLPEGYVARLFPEAARVPAPEPEVVADAGPPTRPGPFAAADFSTYDSDLEPAATDVHAWCATTIGKALASAAQVPPVAVQPRCEEIATGVPFEKGAGFHAVRAVRVFDGSATYSTLLVESALGVSALPVSWDVDDPNDPGCPSIVRGESIEQLRVQNGLLVVVMLGVTTRFVEVPDGPTPDSGARAALVREVTVAKLDGTTIHARKFEAWSGPELGEKVQPTEMRVAWSSLAWKRRRGFVVNGDGTLALR